VRVLVAVTLDSESDPFLLRMLPIYARLSVALVAQLVRVARGLLVFETRSQSRMLLNAKFRLSLSVLRVDVARHV